MEGQAVRDAAAAAVDVVVAGGAAAAAVVTPLAALVARSCQEGDIDLRMKVQGDTSRCLKPSVDLKTKVPFWPGLA